MRGVPFNELLRRATSHSINTASAFGDQFSLSYFSLRAAQLGVDVKVTGVMSLFSWPFEGGIPDQRSAPPFRAHRHRFEEEERITSASILCGPHNEYALERAAA